MFSFWSQLRALVATKYFQVIGDQWINILSYHKALKNEFGKLYEDALSKLLFRAIICCIKTYIGYSVNIEWTFLHFVKQLNKQGLDKIVIYLKVQKGSSTLF